MSRKNHPVRTVTATQLSKGVVAAIGGAQAPAMESVRIPDGKGGFTLLQLLITSALTMAIGTGAFYAFRSAGSEASVHAEQSNLAAISQQAGRIYGPQGSYAGLDSAAAISNKVAPYTMVKGANLRSRWGESVKVDAAAVNGVPNSGVQVTYSRVPTRICIGLANATQETAWDILVNDQTIIKHSVVAGNPVAKLDRGDLVQKCNAVANGSKMTFVFAHATRTMASGIMAPVQVPEITVVDPGAPTSSSNSSAVGSAPGYSVGVPSTSVPPLSLPPPPSGAPGPAPSAPWSSSPPPSAGAPAPPNSPTCVSKIPSSAKLNTPTRCDADGTPACSVTPADGKPASVTNTRNVDVPMSCPSGMILNASVPSPGVAWASGWVAKKPQSQTKYRYEIATCPDPYGNVVWRYGSGAGLDTDGYGPFSPWADTGAAGPDLSPYCAAKCVPPAPAPAPAGYRWQPCPAGTVAVAHGGSGVDQTRTGTTNYACASPVGNTYTPTTNGSPWSPDVSTACAPRCQPSTTNVALGPETQQGSCPAGQATASGATTFTQTRTGIRTDEVQCFTMPGYKPIYTGPGVYVKGADIWNPWSPVAGQVCSPVCTAPAPDPAVTKPETESRTVYCSFGQFTSAGGSSFQRTRTKTTSTTQSYVCSWGVVTPVAGAPVVTYTDWVDQDSCKVLPAEQRKCQPELTSVRQCASKCTDGSDSVEFRTRVIDSGTCPSGQAIVGGGTSWTETVTERRIAEESRQSVCEQEFGDAKWLDWLPVWGSWKEVSRYKDTCVVQSSAPPSNCEIRWKTLWSYSYYYDNYSSFTDEIGSFDGLTAEQKDLFQNLPTMNAWAVCRPGNNDSYERYSMPRKNCVSPSDIGNLDGWDMVSVSDGGGSHACDRSSTSTDQGVAICANVCDSPSPPPSGGGSTPPSSPSCPASAPPADTHTVACPAGETGTITMTRGWVKPAGSCWVKESAWTTTSYNCSKPPVANPQIEGVADVCAGAALSEDSPHSSGASIAFMPDGSISALGAADNNTIMATSAGSWYKTLSAGDAASNYEVRFTGTQQALESSPEAFGAAANVWHTLDKRVNFFAMGVGGDRGPSGTGPLKPKSGGRVEGTFEIRRVSDPSTILTSKSIKAVGTMWSGVCATSAGQNPSFIPVIDSSLGGGPCFHHENSNVQVTVSINPDGTWAAYGGAFLPVGVPKDNGYAYKKVDSGTWATSSINPRDYTVTYVNGLGVMPGAEMNNGTGGGFNSWENAKKTTFDLGSEVALFDWMETRVPVGHQIKGEIQIKSKSTGAVVSRMPLDVELAGGVECR